MFQVLSILLVITAGVLCSGTQQGVSSTQAGQTLQIQSNARKYNKHTTTEKPCTTGSTTGTRKDKPESADAQDYVAIGGAAGPGYPYPSYPYPVQGGRPVQQYYPYEPQYPVETVPPPGGPYYAPYYPAASAPAPPPPYYPAASAPPPPYYPAASAPPPPPPYYPAPGSPYAALPYPPAAYPAQQQLYEQQSTVVDAYRSPLAYLQQADGPQQSSPSQQQFYRQPGAAPYHYPPYNYIRAHAYNNRPAAAPTPPAFLQQRDATGAAAAAAANNVEPAAAQQLQYEQQQSSTGGGGQFDGVNQFHHY